MQTTLEAPNTKQQPSGSDIVEQDLDYICAGLSKEFANLKGKRLLIIGGAGFLGYYLVQAILHFNKAQSDADKAELLVYDNFIRGVPQWLTALEGSPKFSVQKHDVIDPMPQSAGDLDYIVHAASIASPMFYRKYPIETMDANVNGLRNVLEYALAQKKAGKPMTGILFYSTSEIYGDPTPEDIPTPETYRGNVSCTGPRACYDESKRYGETLCVNFAQQHDIPVRIARPFNNYGPGLKLTDARVLPDFVRDVLNERDIVMLSDGSPTRTFCYITDAIVGYYKIMFNGRNGEAYNIGIESPEISMRQLADMVVERGSELFGYKGEVVFKNSADKEYLTDNPNRRCPIIEKARTELGYNPTVDVKEGLRRAMLWYKDNQETVEA
jgi:nucleoside-diphosphate-sugar epimerase